MNTITMRTGKSKLFNTLVHGETLFVIIGDKDISNVIPHLQSYLSFDSFEQAVCFISDSKTYWEECNYETVIFYSNDILSQNRYWIRLLDHWVGGECIFMFREEICESAMNEDIVIFDDSSFWNIDNLKGDEK